MWLSGDEVVLSDRTDNQFPSGWSNMVPGWTWREWWETYDPPNFVDHIYDILNSTIKSSPFV